MKIQLIVKNGPLAGTIVTLPTPRCLVGRGDECDLRPASDRVGLKHCEILALQGQVSVRQRDVNRMTFVNGVRIAGLHRLRHADVLTVGPLDFVVSIEYGFNGVRRSRANGVREVAERTATHRQVARKVDDGDVLQWLEEANHVAMQRWRADTGLSLPIPKSVTPPQRSGKAAKGITGA